MPITMNWRLDNLRNVLYNGLAYIIIEFQYTMKITEV